MNIKERFKYLIFGLICMMLGTLFISPAIAHVVSSKNAHTLTKHHLAYFASRAWTKKYFYTKGQADSRYVNTSGNESMSGELTAGDFNYSSAKTKYLTISESAFVPERDMVLGGLAGYGLYKISGDGLHERVFANVSLPTGAVIKAVRFCYYDNHASSITGGMYHKAINTFGNDIIANFTSANGTYSEVSGLNETVSEGQRYWVQVDLTNSVVSDLLLYGARIEYTVPEP
jgi:hypothetical protein